MNDLGQHLEELLQGRVRMMGLGNVDYGDDGFGVRLAEELLEAGATDVLVAGTEPERYIGRVVDEGLDVLIFLDAVDFGAAPGSVVFLRSSEISVRYPQISTHKISLSVLAQWVRASGKTKVRLLGVQPESMKGGRQLTPTVTATLDLLRNLLLDLAASKKHVGADAPVRPARRSSALTPEDEAITVC
jgi:hydrogenase maturation protease